MGISWESLGNLFGIFWESLGNLLGIFWESLENLFGTMGLNCDPVDGYSADKVSGQPRAYRLEDGGSHTGLENAPNIHYLVSF